MTPSSFTEKVCKQVNYDLEQHLSNTKSNETLLQAMKYTTLAPGKRLRPQLVYISGTLLEAEWGDLSLPACATELIHTYSLIHDDLPAMDDANIRRGRPSCHIKFSETTAILAGDALQPLAFEILANHPAVYSYKQRINMIKVLAQAIGAQGMVAGQIEDITNSANDINSLSQMYSLKTGALLNASTELGAIAAGCSDNPLRLFSKNIGLAYQIQDDILDIESTTATLGKPQQADFKNSKTTYPMLVGIKAAQETVRRLFEEALASVNLTTDSEDFLYRFTLKMLNRSF